MSMNSNSQPLIERMQEAIIYFLTEIHPTLQDPEFVKFRNAIWMQRSWFFENPVVARWMLNHLRLDWYRFDVQGLREEMLLFFSYHIGVVTGGPETDREFEALINQSLTPGQQQSKVQQWNTRLGLQHITNSRFHTITDLVREVFRVNELIEERLHDYYHSSDRDAILSCAERHNGVGFLKLPVDILHQIKRDSLRVNIPRSGGPNPLEVREYIMGLRVWSEL